MQAACRQGLHQGERGTLLDAQDEVPVGAGYSNQAQPCPADTSNTLHTGGGYTKENVARCWTYETSCLVGQDIPEELPANLYYDYYAPGHTLNRSWCKETGNMNTRTRSLPSLPLAHQLSERVCRASMRLLLQGHLCEPQPLLEPC